MTCAEQGDWADMLRCGCDVLVEKSEVRSGKLAKSSARSETKCEV